LLSYRWSEPALALRLPRLVSPQRRVLFRLGRFNVYSYPAALYSGLVAGVYAGYVLTDDAHANRFAVAVLVLMGPALAGARLLFVATNWRIYRADPRRILQRREGGMAMYGGLLLALPLSPLVLHAVGLGFGEFWDGATATMILGTVFTRIGCFLNGCCRGRRLPTPLLESGASLLLFASYVALWPHFPFAGAGLLYGLAGYGAVRFLLEFTRDRDGRVSFAQVFSATAVLICLPLYLALWLA
jgi:phosphatidylglycerol:prolipoprotein diacylglycerol transferase